MESHTSGLNSRLKSHHTTAIPIAIGTSIFHARLNMRRVGDCSVSDDLLIVLQTTKVTNFLLNSNNTYQEKRLLVMTRVQKNIRTKETKNKLLKQFNLKKICFLCPYVLLYPRFNK